MLQSHCMEKPLANPRLHEFFLHTTEQTFHELGVGDEHIVGYVAAVLTDFAHSDRLYALRDGRGRPIDGVADLRRATGRAASDGSHVMRARAAQKYVGDYALFMTGLFRTYVEGRGALGYYVEEGQRSYRAVSEVDLNLFRTGYFLFEELAKNFEHYSGALDYMRKAYFTPQAGQSPFAEFLRRVEGWITSGLSDN